MFLVGKGRLKKTYLLRKKQNLKAGKQSSSVINGPTSHKIIDRKEKEKLHLHTQLKLSESLCTFLL